MRYGLFVLALLMACAVREVTGPYQARRLGTIAGFNNNDPNITILRDGRTVTVSVTSYGGGCESKGETELAVSGLSAVVTPYDYTYSATGACTQQLKSFVHSTSIEFAEPGTAQITIRGLDGRTRSANNLIGDTLSVVRTVELP